MQRTSQILVCALKALFNLIKLVKPFDNQRFMEEKKLFIMYYFKDYLYCSPLLTNKHVIKFNIICAFSKFFVGKIIRTIKIWYSNFRKILAASLKLRLCANQ